VDEQRQADIKQAGLRSRSVMAWLRDHKLPAEPICYTVAYEYLFTENLELKNNVDSLDYESEDSKQALEKIYKDCIISQHYAELSMHSENINSYVAEVLSLLVKSREAIDEVSGQVNKIRGNLEHDDAAENLAEQAKLLEQCSDELKSKLNDKSVEIESLQDKYLEIKEEASKDELTQILDQKGLMTTLNAAIKHEENYPFSVIRVDIDHFKQFNDANGENMGNAVLKQIAKAFTSQLKGTDIISRFEEDEFLLILPKTPVDNGMAVAQILRKRVESISLKKKGALKPVKVTISSGVSIFEGNGKFDVAMENARKAMQRSKDLGRNGVNKDV
jgi:diguanylate cyclase